MRTPALSDVFDERTIPMAYTVDEYHSLIVNGLIIEGEPYELLDGYVIRKDRSAVGEDPMTVGNEHSWAVTALQELCPRLRKHGCYMRIQQPVTLPPDNEPEPDGAIALGSKDDYLEANLGAKDTLCVIEVADASLKRDRTTKQRIYANHGIQQYIIVNLPDRAIEVYTQPIEGKGRYSQIVT